MSQEDKAHAWWSRLRHQGLLLSPVVMMERYPTAPEPAPYPAMPKLRDAHTRFISTADARRSGDDQIEQAAILNWVDHLLEPFLGHRWGRLAKQHDIPEKLAAVVRIGSRSETLRPHRVVFADANATVPALLVMADTSATIGRGRGRTKYAQLLELLRGTGHRLGLLTNGRQFRLVYAGLDFESWSEWESDRWFDDGEGSEELAGLRQLLSPESLSPAKVGVSGLLDAIEESRKRQADLSSVLRENVRQAVEFLLEDVSAANRTDSALFHALMNPEGGPALSDAQAYEALYQATVRVVMRLVVCLFAESRKLLPTDDPLYAHAYGVRQLYERLEEAVRNEGGVHTLFNKNTAWPRMMALFRLIHGGSAHGSFPMRAYGGALFRPGVPTGGDAVARALHMLEHAVPVGDSTLHAVLRKLLRGPLPVLRGRQKTFVEGPVDYTELRTEFIGLIYEGLLDYRIRRTDAEIGPQVFLNIGREPVLPLRRLEDMLAHDRSGLKNLLTTLRKEQVTATVSTEGDDEAEEEAEEATDDQPESAEVLEAEVEAETFADEGPHGGDYLDAVEAARRWAGEAVVLAGLVGRQTRRESDAEYRKRIEAEANRLIKRVVATGEFYLVRAGNTRKGTGTYYTRPQLAVPTVHRTLEPLCYDKAEDGTLTPKEPEAILGLKVCDPACGSASFLVAALHYLSDALYRSLCHHRHLDAPERAKRITLPYGRPRTGKEGDELVPFPPDDPQRGHTFEERIKALLRRHVVERSIYGVDINPLAVELARVSLWVETLDPDLPFSFLDHKVRVGNALVGCWLDRVEDYPLRAWEREGGDGPKGERSGRIETLLKGEKVGNRRSGDGIIKREMREVIEGRFTGQPPLFPEMGVTTETVVAQARADYEALHALPPGTDPDERERFYRERILGSPAGLRLRRAMDQWCAVWFWPTDEESLRHVPTPLSFHAEPSEARSSIISDLASDLKFFHWELEYPDVFTPDRSGFDAMIGNPPWDVMKPNSQEFFTDYDPLYRTYDKQKALQRQRLAFAEIPGVVQSWEQYNAHFKAMSNWAGKVSDPFDVTLARGRDGSTLASSWAKHRQERPGFADPEHPFRLQGSADLNSYKMFAEAFWNLMRADGRVGVIVPTGIYSDFGTKALRETLLNRGRIDLLYAFQNEKRVFSAAHHSFKQVALIAAKGGRTTAFRTRFRMGVGDSPEAHEIPDDLLRNDSSAMVFTPEDVRLNSPKSLSLVELRSVRDLEIFQSIYANSIRIGDEAPGWEITYATEFHTTNDSRYFPSTDKWEDKGYKSDEFGRWIGPEGDVALPLYQGGMLHILNPHFNGFSGNQWRELPADRATPIPKFLMGLDDYRRHSASSGRNRVAYRRIARTTDTRTFIGCFSSPLPSSDSLFLLLFQQDELVKPLAAVAAWSSLTFDWIVRQRLTGTNLSWFVLQECPLPSWLSGDAWARAKQLVLLAVRLCQIHRRFAPEWLKLKQLYPELDGREWKQWWAVTEADRLRLRVEIDALCADLYGLEPDDFDWIVRDDPTDPKGFYRVDRQFPFRERLTGLAAAAFRALKDGRWSAESAASLSNDEFFALLGIPELTSAQAAQALGLPSPLIEKRGGCHAWRPESFPPEDPRHGWTWDHCWNDAVALLGDEEAVHRYLAGEEAEDSADEPEPFLRSVPDSPQARFKFSGVSQATDEPDSTGATGPDVAPADDDEEEPFQLSASPGKKRPAEPQPPPSRTTDLHVALIVRIIYAHQKASGSAINTLGSVKAEKIAHLVESHLGLDLGRKPVRDAAGPVDFPHLKKIVHRATKTYAFTTKERSGGVGAIFVPLAGFQKAVGRSEAVLGDRLGEVDQLIQLFIAFDSDRAEVVATLYSVWNDLLAGGLDAGDDQIIAGFYGWAPSKTKFERDRLEKALNWMRAHGLVPTGQAKRTDHPAS